MALRRPRKNRDTISTQMPSVTSHTHIHTMSLADIPGLDEEVLRSCIERNTSIRSGVQLVGQFLLLREPGMTDLEHCNAFWRWLRSLGVCTHTSRITSHVAMQASLAFPGVIGVPEVASSAGTESSEGFHPRFSVSSSGV